MLAPVCIAALVVWVVFVADAQQAAPAASVFRVFGMHSTLVTMPHCRAVCAAWQHNAYVATLLTQRENTLLRTRAAGTNQVLLGGQRDTTSSLFRWTEGPLGRVNNSRGVVFWTGGTVANGGVCSAAMYCNFDPIQPDAARSTETLLTMFASSGRWNDIAAGDTNLNACACRWDPVVFDVFPVSPTNVSLQYCRWCCATWRPSAYVATILSAEENAMVYALLWRNWSFAAFGATRQPDGSGVESLRFRWTEGPLGAANGGLGTLLWSRTGTMWNGTGVCAPGLYCNFLLDRPDNAVPGNQVQLVLTALNALDSRFRGSWEDRSYSGVSSSSFDGCVCRHDVTSLSVSESSTAGITTSINRRTFSLALSGTTTIPTSTSISLSPLSTSGGPSATQSLSLLSYSTTATPSTSITWMARFPGAAQTFSLSLSRSLSASQYKRFRSSTASVDAGQALLSLPSALVAVGSVASGAQWVSAVSAASGSASVVGRVAAVRLLALCRPGDSSGLVLFSITDGADDAGSARADARGAAVTGGLLVGAAAVVLLLAAGALCAATDASLRCALLRVALPSSLHPVSVMQSSVAAAAQLLPLRSTADWATLLVAAGVACVPLLLLCVAPRYVERTLRLELVESAAAPRDAHRHAAWLWGVLWARTARWMAPSACPLLSARCAWVLLLEYRALWYPALDAAVLIAVSAAAAASVAAESLAACRVTVALCLTLFLAQLTVVVLWRPLLLPAAHVIIVATLVLSCATALLHVLVLWDVGPVEDLVAASGLLQLVTLGVGCVKLPADVYGLLRALLRFGREFCVARPKASQGDALRERLLATFLCSEIGADGVELEKIVDAECSTERLDWVEDSAAGELLLVDIVELEAHRVSSTTTCEEDNTVEDPYISGPLVMRLPRGVACLTLAEAVLLGNV